MMQQQATSSSIFDSLEKQLQRLSLLSTTPSSTGTGNNNNNNNSSVDTNNGNHHVMVAETKHNKQVNVLHSTSNKTKNKKKKQKIDPYNLANTLQPPHHKQKKKKEVDENHAKNSAPKQQQQKVNQKNNNSTYPIKEKDQQISGTGDSNNGHISTVNRRGSDHAIVTNAPNTKKVISYQQQQYMKKKKFTGACIDLARSFPTIALSCRGMNDSDVLEFTQWTQKSEKLKSILERKKVFRCNIELQENSISDEGIRILVDYLLAHSSQIHVNALKLWKNNIGDEGAAHLARFIEKSEIPLTELHLSHNRISNTGAIALFKAIEHNPLYPRLAKNGATTIPDQLSVHANTDDHQQEDEQQNSNINSNNNTDDVAVEVAEQRAPNETTTPPNMEQIPRYCPLWLRLEWNFVNVESLSEQYDLKACLSPCDASNRLKCGPSGCCHEPSSPQNRECKVHLYVFHLQYSKPEESILLTDAKKKIEQIKQTKKEEATVSEKTAPIQDSFANKSSDLTDKCSSDLPTYIFIDTCAILSMIDAPKHVSVKPSDHKFCQSFNFKSLIQMAKSGKFGNTGLADGDKIHLIITDTIMQEVDHRKSKERREWLREAIRRQLQSEKGYMEMCSRLKFMTCLGAHQGELLLKSSNMHFFSSPNSQQDGNLYNDLKLLEVAMFWSQELGFNKNVIILTSDYEVKRRAKKHNIPAELLKNIDRSLTSFVQNNPDAPWTASVIKSCMRSAFEELSSANVISASTRPTSIFGELEQASALVHRLVTALDKRQSQTLEKDADDATGDSLLIDEAQEAVSRWRNLLESSRDWLHKTT